MTIKTKESVKLDQILKLLFSTSDRVLLSMLNSIFDENLLLDKVKIRKSNNEFISYSLEDIHGDIFFEIEDLGVEKSINFHIEFQTKNDNSMVIRMFEYGFKKSLESIESDDFGVVMTFPKQRVIFIEENSCIKDSLEAIIILPDGNEFKYTVPIMKYWEYNDEMLIKNKMYPLIPLQIFLLRKEIAKAKRSNDINKIKYFSNEILDLSWKIGSESTELLNKDVIEFEDYEKMLIAIKSLVEYFKDNYIDDETLIEEATRMIKTLYDPEVARKAMEKGIEKGIEKGMARGIEKGIEKGIEQGIEKGKIQYAKKMLELGVDIEIVAKAMDLPVDKAKKLLM